MAIYDRYHPPVKHNLPSLSKFLFCKAGGWPAPKIQSGATPGPRGEVIIHLSSTIFQVCPSSCFARQAAGLHRRFSPARHPARAGSGNLFDFPSTPLFDGPALAMC
jgi:hypothetical protein